MIHHEIKQFIPAMRDLCRTFGVSRLEIFGSAVTDDFNPDSSDVDLLVSYPPDYEFGPWAGRFFDLERALVELLHRDVDLIMSDAPRNPRFLANINATKEVIFDEYEAY